MSGTRVVALLATYNERRFIGGCLEHLHRHGVESYVIDNASDDGTAEIVADHQGRGVIGLETLPRNGTFDWAGILRRKEQLAQEIDADWLIHLDADEIRLPPPGHKTLATALAAVGEQGYNAVNFFEFTFMPTRESPDHDHPSFRETLRTYYPFAPNTPHRLNAWAPPSPPHQLKAWRPAAAGRPDLHSTAGHRVSFPGLKVYPRSFPMKHYLFLSPRHALEKYGGRRYDHDEVERGWHGWRTRVTTDDLHLPSDSELRTSRSDRDLDPSAPRHRHYLDELVSVT